MKKILTIFLTLAVMLTAAACGAKEEGTESSPAPSSAAEESSSEASLPEPGPVPTEVGGEGLALMEQMTAALEGTGRLRGQSHRLDRDERGDDPGAPLPEGGPQGGGELPHPCEGGLL